MLYIVQVVMWGVAETPRLFTDEARARAAFVEGARKNWEQRYSAYCEHHGVGNEDFASAQAFVKALDVSEKSTINLWSFSADEAGLGETKPAAGSEEFGLLAKEVVAVKEGLTRLLGDVSKLVDRFAAQDTAPVEAQAVEAPQEKRTPSSAAPQQKQEADPGKYATKEWSNFVAEIRGACSGSKNECALLPRGMWRHDVYGNLTALEYWDWVADRMVNYKERAQAANYTVIADPDSLGYHRFSNAEGDLSEDDYRSEWEAWCAAGLHLETT